MTGIWIYYMGKKIQGNKDKIAFRKTKEWKDFSSMMRAKHTVCECCGTKSKRLQVHHAFPDDYKNLDEENFYVLCSSCHRFIERAGRIKPENYKRYNLMWIEFCYRFFCKRNC